MARNGHARYSRDTPQRARTDLIPVQIGGESYEFKYSTKCRVCTADPEVLSEINGMIVNGETYTTVYREAREMDKRSRPITYNSVYTHGQRHVPSASKAVRRIIEERSERMNRDFVEGTKNLLDEYIYSEVVMTKAFEGLTAEGAQVSTKDGLEAAKFLHQIKAGETEGQNLTAVLAQLSEIISAVRSTVPEYMYSQILERLENPQKTAIVSAEVEEEEAFDPVVEDDDDEED
jgi:hypothetical protein